MKKAIGTIHSDLTRAQMLKRGLAMCDQVSALEDQLKAAKADVRRLKRELKASEQSGEQVASMADEVVLKLAEAEREIERQRGILAEKGVVELPAGALKAMENRVAEIAATPNRTRMMEEFRG